MVATGAPDTPAHPRTHGKRADVPVARQGHREPQTALGADAAAFRAHLRARRAEARQRAALLLICGIDLAAALATRGCERTVLCRRLRRHIERERLKGARGLWSYDLDRHIALGEALGRLEREVGRAGAAQCPNGGLARRGRAGN